MLQNDPRTVEQIRSLISEYNEEATKSRQYSKRRLAKTTPTIFYDDQSPNLPTLRWSPVGWCKIRPNLAALLEMHRIASPVISYKANDQKDLLLDEEFSDACKSEIPQHLTHLSEVYLHMHYQLAGTYGPESQTRVRAKIEALEIELHENNTSFLNKNSVISHIRKQLKEAKSMARKTSDLTTCRPNPNELVQKVLQLRRQNEYSVKDICSLCKVSLSTYYAICKRADRCQVYNVPPRGRPLNENSLTSYEIERIKYLADTPTKSYTVPEMCADIAENFRHPVSRKMVYYQLTKKLGYSFKRNHFKNETVFEPEQAIVRYKVCIKLIEYLRQGKNIICLDETGFHLGVQREYSYCKRGRHPFRIKPGYSEKRNIMMVITNEKIFAYTIRAKGNNEHSFAGFIVDLTQRICQLGTDCISNTVLFMDNAPFHTSGLATKLLNVLPFPVLMNAVCASDYNPIESIFSIMKRRFKAKNCTKM